MSSNAWNTQKKLIFLCKMFEKSWEISKIHLQKAFLLCKIHSIIIVNLYKRWYNHVKQIVSGNSSSDDRGC